MIILNFIIFINDGNSDVNDLILIDKINLMWAFNFKYWCKALFNVKLILHTWH